MSPSRVKGTPSAFTVASRLATSATLSICAPLSMRFMKPLNAVPGPSSMNRVKPCASRQRMDFSQSTDDVTCSTSRAEISAGAPCACAVTLEITGTPGAEKSAFSPVPPAISAGRRP
jgi:hypothetical protein